MLTQIITTIEALGYTHIIVNTKGKLTVMVDGRRDEVQKQILSAFPDAVKEFCTSSSIGRILIDGKYKVYIKPLSARTGVSAYSINEQVLHERIAEHAKVDRPITVQLVSDDKTITIENVVGSEMCGTDTKDRKKADVNLTLADGGQYGISLKMDNAGHWESADRYYREKAGIILQHLLDRGIVKLTTNENGINKIYPNVVIEATPEEVVDVTFGNDLLGHGCILVRTLEESDFAFDHNTNILTIRSTICADSPKDSGISNNVWFMLRNDSTRKTESILKGVNGLRVTSINRRTRSSKQLLVSKEWLDIILDSKKQSPK